MEFNLTEGFLKRKQIVSGSKKELIEGARGVLVHTLTAVDKHETHQCRVDQHDWKTNASFPDGNPISNLNSLSNWTDNFSTIPDFIDKDTVYTYTCMTTSA